MFFAHVKGLGFMRFLSVDGGKSQQLFFTSDPEQATKWESEEHLIEELNGEIAKRDFQILRIEWI